MHFLYYSIIRHGPTDIKTVGKDFPIGRMKPIDTGKQVRSVSRVCTGIPKMCLLQHLAIMLLLPSTLASSLIKIKTPCTDMVEYFHPQFGCKTCDGCTKGTGIDINQQIKRDEYGMKSCYSCYRCSNGTFQDKEITIESCKPCNDCVNQKTVRSCSHTNNAICGECWPGYMSKKVNGSIKCVKYNGNGPKLESMTVKGKTFMVLFIITLLLLFGLVAFNVYLVRTGACTLPVIPCNRKTKGKPGNPPKKALFDVNDAIDDCADTIKESEHKVSEEVAIEKVPLVNTCNGLSVNLPHDLSELEKIPYADNEVEELNEDEYEAKADIIIAKEIGSDWKFFARFLLKDADIDEIVAGERTLRDCAYCAIVRFRQIYPKDEKSIVRALIEIKRKDLLNKKEERVEMECPEKENSKMECPEKENNKIECPEEENSKMECPEKENNKMECPEKGNNKMECPEKENRKMKCSETDPLLV